MKPMIWGFRGYWYAQYYYSGQWVFSGQLRSWNEALRWVCLKVYGVVPRGQG